MPELRFGLPLLGGPMGILKLGFEFQCALDRVREKPGASSLSHRATRTYLSPVELPIPISERSR
jgi:hypothetical protein